jgi:hypothetical protein
MLPYSRVTVLIAIIFATAVVAPAAARHPHDGDAPDAILRLLGQADDALAASRTALQSSPELSASGSAIAPLRDPLERTMGQMRSLRTAIHVAFEVPRIHEDDEALKSVEKLARDMAKMSAALQTMSTTVLIVSAALAQQQQTLAPHELNSRDAPAAIVWSTPALPHMPLKVDSAEEHGLRVEVIAKHLE